MGNGAHKKWSNCIGNQQVEPYRLLRPTTLEEIVEIVKLAESENRKVRAVGSGHSFSDIALTEGLTARTADPLWALARQWQVGEFHGEDAASPIVVTAEVAYTPLTAFTIESGFAAGINTLDFEINDFGCPNGLRVDLSGTALVSQ